MKLRPSRLAAAAALIGVSTLLSACSALYYGAMSQVGMEVRDILVDRVVNAKEVQVEAQEQFKSALEVFQEVSTSDENTELQTVYKRLKGEYDDCESRAKAVTKRIDDVEDASNKLFDDWEDDIATMTDAKLKSQNEDLRRNSMQDYEQLISKMREAESKMPPVLDAFRNRVTFLKGAVNAEAISSLSGDLIEIEDDVADLIADMQASIDEADEFIATMGGPDA